jgi:tetratricopeptide (TPR) repeat protein
MECGAMRIRSTVLLACLAAGCGSADEPSTTQAPAQNAAPVVAQAPSKPAPVTEAPQSAVPANAGVAADLVVKAEKLHRQGDVVGAVRALTAAIAANPQSAELFAKRAALLAHANLLPKAIADISRSIDLETTNPRFRNTRGFYYLSQRDYDRAINDFNDAIGIDLSYAHPYNNRGLAKIALGQHDAAVADFDAALRIDP